MAVLHLSRRVRWTFFILVILFILLLVVDMTGFGKEALSVSLDLSGDSDTVRLEFLRQYGWQVSADPLEVAQITLPKTCTGALAVYNDLQKAQGMDLTPYLGKKVTRYTYEVQNYPQKIEGVRADLLVCDGRIIAGDIGTVASDGFMHGLERDSNGISAATFAYVGQADR